MDGHLMSRRGGDNGLECDTRALFERRWFEKDSESFTAMEDLQHILAKTGGLPQDAVGLRKDARCWSHNCL